MEDIVEKTRELNVIHTITLYTDFVSKKRIDGTIYKVRENRSVGFYFKKDDAINSVLNDVNLMRDDCYVLAVVETISEGVYAYTNPTEQAWLAWDNNHTCWQFIDAPDDMMHTCGFALG